MILKGPVIHTSCPVVHLQGYFNDEFTKQKLDLKEGGKSGVGTCSTAQRRCTACVRRMLRHWLVTLRVKALMHGCNMYF
jgi:hypothetical protein